MQLTTGRETLRERRPTLDMQETARRILAIERELQELRRLESDGEAEAEAFRSGTEEEFRRRRSEGDNRERDSLRALEEKAGAAEEELRARRDRRRARALRAFEKMRGGCVEALKNERERCKNEIKEAADRLSAADDRRRVQIQKRSAQWERALERTREAAAGTKETIHKFASAHGIALEEAREEPTDDEGGADADPESLAADAEQAIADALVAVRRARILTGTSLARRAHLFLYYFMVLLLHGGALALALYSRKDIIYIYLAIAVSLVTAIVLLQTGTRHFRGRLESITADALAKVTVVFAGFERRATAAMEGLDAQQMTSAENLFGDIMSAEEAAKVQSERRSAAIGEDLQKLQDRHDRLEGKCAADHARRLEGHRAEQDAQQKRLRESIATEREAAAAEHRERIQVHEASYAETLAEGRERRRALLDDFARFIRSAQEDRRRLHPPWDESGERPIELPEAFPQFVTFGHLRVSGDPQAAAGESEETSPIFTPPVALTFPDQGSLLLRHGGEDREQALEILFNTVLRILLSFPAGKARLTIIDPVGLGESFSALMHLADHDESLVHGRIWTEVRHIEQRLTDLTEHIEKVIQKYLRNRYDSIAEYNLEAGELQEPCHFLVVADFPAALNEKAVERITSIVSSGPRCGVYTLIAQDTRQEVPDSIDLARLAENGLLLHTGDDGFAIEREGLDRGVFVPERSPAPETASRMLDDVGRLSVDAGHVELPFTAVIPTDDEIWTASTARSVRVPIGRSGASRLQYLELGRGTAQHALIAGRTGSGKSTLFHVIITNLALWFSPEEVELYLIDFKKGVEFKPYAVHGLPHARVVAIESDREFGLSVLRALAAELGRRGDLFRKRGVQDLTSWRRLPDAGPLPRILLLIDEFQEYFTEDDAVARDAALLLDRFVRQGRAFGIHVVLGSQTLSGIYTLAKSSLGQMGVRIALQCNEADSLLILSEDNTAARLLSRPGDAIYNDLSGLVEGNNPFQVVWLSEEMQGEQLRRLSEKVAAEPPRYAPETVVFEGNVPAELRRNPALAALLDSPFASAEGDDRVWLGEPNAIKGPTTVHFRRDSGSNLLMIGQQREAVIAMMTGAIASLCARYRPGDVRIVILDGGGHDPAHAEHIQCMIDAVPHDIAHHDARAAEGLLAELAARVNDEPDDPPGMEDEGGETAAEKPGPPAAAGQDDTPTFLIVLGLHRLRMLRQKDDFSMSFDDSGGSSPSDQFLKILTDGPSRGVHSIVWCDGFNNVLRTLGRQTLREFDMRVLFQMSAADSSELIDSSAANLLGLHNALLSVESGGTMEKFRPYALPDRETLAWLADALRARLQRSDP